MDDFNRHLNGLWSQDGDDFFDDLNSNLRRLSAETEEAKALRGGDARGSFGIDRRTA